MTFEEFNNSLKDKHPPEGIGKNLKALWEDAKGNWHEAHNIVQDTSGVEGDWIHAYLHRKEGDLSNASYWYRRAGKSTHTGTLREEWEQLVRALLS